MSASCIGNATWLTHIRWLTDTPNQQQFAMNGRWWPVASPPSLSLRKTALSSKFFPLVVRSPVLKGHFFFVNRKSVSS